MKIIGTVFLMSAIVPVVPGLGLYRMMAALGQGQLSSGAELGISETAKLHLATCTHNLTYAIDTHYPHLADDILEGGMLKFKDGTMRAPDKPGLGVSLDMDKFARYAEANRKAGLREGYEKDPGRPADWCPKKFQW